MNIEVLKYHMERLEEQFELAAAEAMEAVTKAETIEVLFLGAVKAFEDAEKNS